MGAGLSLIVFGALLTFAVRVELSGFSFESAGVIFMVAGAALVLADWWRQRRRRSETVETYTDSEGQQIRHTTVHDDTYE